MASTVATIPLVDYLVLSDPPHLRANECVACGARFLDRRNACAACSGTEFRAAPLPRTGRVVSFTIVHVAAPGITVPYVAAVVDCGGTWVRANLVGVEPDPAHLELGTAVELVTFVHGSDTEGTEAIGFGFSPRTEGAA